MINLLFRILVIILKFHERLFEILKACFGIFRKYINYFQNEFVLIILKIRENSYSFLKIWLASTRSTSPTNHSRGQSTTSGPAYEPTNQSKWTVIVSSFNRSDAETQRLGNVLIRHLFGVVHIHNGSINEWFTSRLLEFNDPDCIVLINLYSIKRSTLIGKKPSSKK